MISDASHHTFSDMDFIEANILIDKDGNARLADFGSTILSEDLEDSEGPRTLRWMSPELLDPDSRATKESDCYALGMVVFEVLTGKIPFQDFNNLAVMMMLGGGERPGRPKGQDAVWFTDNLWETLEQCWLYKSELRPTVEGVLECLEQHPVTLKPDRGPSHLSPEIQQQPGKLQVSTMSQWLFFLLTMYDAS